MRNIEEYGIDEIDAKKASLVFIGLDGDIGCMVNGAGLAMATMDLIKYYGGMPANFLDIGGSSNPKKVVEGLKILIRNKKIKAVLLNIFGGITRCDDIANGLVAAKKEVDLSLPLVIRLIGTNDKEGIGILKNNGFTVFSDLGDAVKEAVKQSIKI
jgi:succinyl-CoA synthetase beta subunit